VSDLSIFGGVDYDEGSTRAERRRHQHRRRRRRNPLGPLLGVVLIVALVGGIFYGGRLVLGKFGDVPDYVGEGAGAVTVQVKSGDTATDIAVALTKLGVVKSERAFRDAAKEDPRSPTIQPGFYRLRKQMSGQAALTLLLDPAARVQSKLTVPEGLSAVETLKLIATKTGTPLPQLQAAAKNAAALGLPAYAAGRLEGFLFPATYEIDPGTPAVQILRTLVATYKQRVDDSGVSARAGALGINPYQLLTVASLLEEEAITPDFGKVARVIYNRISSGQPLQLDSTVNYALHRNRIRVSAQDLQVNSPYNTYRRAGLPPTPIANPGSVAIQAALHPAAGPWLYFVKQDKAGHSYFTADYQDFLDAKQRAQSAGIF
jgi:UPF0755 protein